MNVYVKLQKCRVDLQKSKLKKTGNNKFAGYTYYELCDFLPRINELMLENGLSSFVQFTSEIATLTILDIEKPDQQIQFTSPMATANLKGCHDVQNLGAVQTYIRRYLYTNAFEIVESDALDGTLEDKEIKPEIKKESKLKNNEDTKDLRQEIRNMLLQMSNNNKAGARKLLATITKWTNKDGKEIAGKETVDDISEAALKPSYGKVKVEYEKWLSLNQKTA